VSDEISSNSRLTYLRDQAEAAARQHDPDEFGQDQSGRGRRDPDRGGRDGPLSRALARFAARWLPESVLQSGSRSRRLAALAALLGVVGAVVFAVVLIRGGPVAESPPPLPLATERARTTPTDADPSARGKEDEPVVVSVVGKVREPGLVTVPAGSRVAVALDAAGGAHDGVDLTTVNLARKLTDGEQIYVGVPVPAAGAAAGPAGAAGVPAKVNLNTATAEQLDELPGVGEVTAARILDWRSEHGAFTAVEQLREVSGIGDTRLSRLRDHVSVG
jgi:competence protein ComEA